MNGTMNTDKDLNLELEEMLIKAKLCDSPGKSPETFRTASNTSTYSSSPSLMLSPFSETSKSPVVNHEEVRRHGQELLEKADQRNAPNRPFETVFEVGTEDDASAITATESQVARTTCMLNQDTAISKEEWEHSPKVDAQNDPYRLEYEMYRKSMRLQVETHDQALKNGEGIARCDEKLDTVDEKLDTVIANLVSMAPKEVARMNKELKESKSKIKDYRSREAKWKRTDRQKDEEIAKLEAQLKKRSEPKHSHWGARRK